MKIKCYKCGNQVSDKARNCSHCGNIINYEKLHNNNVNIFLAIIVIVIVSFIIFIVMSIRNSIKQDAEYRKQRELREFNTQLHQDPSTWNKEQRDRYDSFIKWDMQNER